MNHARCVAMNANSVRDNRYNLGPDADIAETGDEYIVTLEIPGTFKNDIKIWLEGDVLQVSGEKKAPEKEGSKLLISERAFGKFERLFRIPAEVDRSKIVAQFVDGLLEIRVPKPIEAKSREIYIK